MKILVVDDNESISKMLQKFFKIKGYECTVSTNGRNALDLVLHQKFDVIILDLAMPEFSGYDIIDALEKSDKIKEQNIIVLTASPISTDTINSLLKRGVRSCLRKPVTPDVLLETISLMH